jgi:hypothetical protein
MRWTTVVVLAALAGAAGWAGEGKERAVRFSKDDVGKVPAGWKAEKTGKGQGSVWKVVADDTAPFKTGYVLAQTAESPGNVFNICVLEDSKYKDVDLRVAFKAVRGNKDQGGGFVWRYRDHDNYYIARMNPLEDNYRVYKVVKGVRTQLGQEGTKEDLKVPAGTWHTLRVAMEGDHIRCYLDGKKQLDVKDSTYKDAGKVGLWSKADAETHFDGFKVSGK